jgi:bla regulator protein blaR1
MKDHVDESPNGHKTLVLSIAVAMVIVWVAISAVLTAPRLEAQLQAPVASGLAFEVASVKPNKSGDQRQSIQTPPGGRFIATNLPLRNLIAFAYRIEPGTAFRLVGGPDWIRSERFDIIAKADGNLPPFTPSGPPEPLLVMVRTLLAERFKLAVHHETRDLPIYALVVARTDGKLGPKLRPAAVDCEAAMRARGGLPASPPAPGERPTCGARIGPGQMIAGGVPMAQFVSPLSQFVQRTVIDRTGLTGAFDFDLSWTPDQLPQGPPPPGAPPLPPIDPNGPSIFTALQEQIGLKLDAQRGPVDVVVIDGVERPTED